MANPLAIDLATVAERTASGIGSAVDIGAKRSCVKITVDVQALAGTSPRLQLEVQTSESGSGGWAPAGTIGSFAGASPRDVVLANCRRFVRLTWTLSGTTPSFTFGVSGEAHALYVSPTQLGTHGVPEVALEGLSPEALAASCLAATDEADSALASRYTLPLVSWPDEITRYCAQIAAWDAIATRGLDTGGPDALVMNRAAEASRRLLQIGAGKRSPPGIIDSTPEKRGAAPRVRSAGASQWTDDGE